MISVGLRCHSSGIYYVVLEITEEQRRILEHNNIALGNSLTLPERLYGTTNRLKTIVSRFKQVGLQGVGLKTTEFASLRQRVDEGRRTRLYLEGCVQVAVQECGVNLRAYNAQQTSSVLQTSQRLEGYVKARDFRDISGVDEFPASKRQELTEAMAAALCILEGEG